MLDYIEKKEVPTKYHNCHSLAIIDKQAMKCRRMGIDQLLEYIPGAIKEGKLRDADILYMVPTGKEFHTIPSNRLKNDKFIAAISTPDEVIRKRGSILPLIEWVKETVKALEENHIDFKVRLTRGDLGLDK